MGADFWFDLSGLQRQGEILPEVAREAALEAVTVAARQAEKALEAATAAGVRGNLYRAWNSKAWKNAPGEDPTASVYGKGRARTQGALISQSRGAEIRGRRGQWLAIPVLPAAGEKTLRNARRNGEPMTPETWQIRTGRRLRLVAPRGRRFALLVDVGRNPGGGRRVQRRGPGTVVFVLVPVATLQKRFGVGRYVRAARATMGDTFLAALERGMDELI